MSRSLQGGGIKARSTLRLRPSSSLAGCLERESCWVCSLASALQLFSLPPNPTWELSFPLGSQSTPFPPASHSSEAMHSHHFGPLPARRHGPATKCSRTRDHLRCAWWPDLAITCWFAGAWPSSDAPCPGVPPAGLAEGQHSLRSVAAHPGLAFCIPSCFPSVVV